VEAFLDECWRRRIDPPASDRVDRIVRSAVHAFKERLYAANRAGLSPLTRIRLDVLYTQPRETSQEPSEDSASRAVINTLREDAGHAGVESIRSELTKIDVGSSSFRRNSSTTRCRTN
jgi:hypothetical protein